MGVVLVQSCKMASFADEKPLTEADLPATAAKNRFGGKVAVVTGGASGTQTY